MPHVLSLSLLLFAVWLLLSGFFDPLLLGLGVVSCALVVWLAHRMDVVDHEGHPVHLHFWKVLTYWAWLLKEIVLSNIDVARRILHPQLPISPTVIQLKTSQGSQLGQVIYANSITLTPGTVSFGLTDKTIEVHALSREAAQTLKRGEMDRRVRKLEMPIEKSKKHQKRSRN